MLQEIIVYIILAISFIIALYKMIGFFGVFNSTSSKSACGSCTSGGCGSCSLKSSINQKPPLFPIKIDTERLN